MNIKYLCDRRSRGWHSMEEKRKAGVCVRDRGSEEREKETVLYQMCVKMDMCWHKQINSTCSSWERHHYALCRYTHVTTCESTDKLNRGPFMSSFLGQTNTMQLALENSTQTIYSLIQPRAITPAAAPSHFAYIWSSVSILMCERVVVCAPMMFAIWLVWFWLCNTEKPQNSLWNLSLCVCVYGPGGSLKHHFN